MRENISHLNDVKGSDSTANAIVDHYPGYIDAFVDAAKALAKLKNAQLQQADKLLWKRCADEDENLRKQVKQYLEPPDPEGLDKVPGLADTAKSAFRSPTVAGRTSPAGYATGPTASGESTSRA